MCTTVGGCRYAPRDIVGKFFPLTIRLDTESRRKDPCCLGNIMLKLVKSVIYNNDPEFIELSVAKKQKYGRRFDKFEHSCLSGTM